MLRKIFIVVLAAATLTCRATAQQNAAPADGDLLAGDCSLWFDKTNGAAKLMLKGKTANGTVVTASIALA